MISHGHITRVVKYLVGLREGAFSSIKDFQLITRCIHEDRLWLEKFCDDCRLVRLTNSAKDELTETGRKMADGFICDHDVSDSFKSVLGLYIITERPIWANRMPMGRDETFAVIDDDTYYCFKEAGLARQPISDNIVKWWDTIASVFRAANENDLLAIGRKGERLTLEYELRRTSFVPKWMSVESNFMGYDILSRESREDETHRLIEVKASSSNAPSFFISRNEWEIAQSSRGQYRIYLWRLGVHSELAILTVDEVAAHIAENSGQGSWTSVEVPYGVFADSFRRVDVGVIS